MQLNFPDSVAHVIQEWESPSSSDRHVIIIPTRVLDRYAFEKGVMRLLEFLVQKHNLRLVMPEGASGTLDVTWFKSFPDHDIRAQVADEFMQKGEITGLEVLMITSDYPIDARGIDDAELHRQCAELLKTAQGAIGAVMPAMVQLSHALNTKASAVAPDLHSLEVTLEEYKTRTLDLPQYFQRLALTAEEVGIPLRERFPAFHAAVASLQHPHAHFYRAQLLALRRALGGAEGDADNVDIDDTLEPKDALRGLAFTEEETKLLFELRTHLDSETTDGRLATLLNNRDILTSLVAMTATPFLVATFKQNRQQFSSDYVARCLDHLDISLPQATIEIIDTAVPVMERFY